ncbi:cysteine hydrolase family protein [Thermanaeromonas sp. C210]|uniref:cysteine hydrolase family protein n=1 Tax=Thermanaeromonas sp. C210 TaxID=2731925 RepID=UPI00155D2D09|nr:isochorismatase family cysteine hydrolase [Thermanaeromonas sp. C210]GFN22548.1 hydrolase [Thermanaeromonas sp. C210]
MDLVKRYLEIYGRKEDELLKPEEFKSEGLYAGEKEFIMFAEKEYLIDKHWVFEIKKEECALLVVDLQEDFVNPNSPLCIPEAYRQIPRVKKVIETCRTLGVPVIYMAINVAPDCVHDMYEYWPPIKAGAVKEGTPGADIYHEIYPKEGERVIRSKHSYSSFAGTELDMVLRHLGVKTVIVCGTLTNVCCETTARDAYSRGYHVVFGSDINATDNALAHEATLRTLRRAFARVMTAEQIIQALTEGDSLYHQAVSRLKQS